jgi:hypothetical protein
MEFLLPVALMLLIGGGATWIAWSRHRAVIAASKDGTDTLASLHWRELVKYTLDVMRRRGYAPESETLGGDGAMCPMHRDGRRWLLQCKHGASGMIGPSALQPLLNAIKLENAEGGVFVSPGHVTEQTRALAKLQGVDIVDGAALWPELQPLLVAAGRIPAPNLPPASAWLRQAAPYWALALVLGGASYWFFGREPRTTENAATPAPLASPRPLQEQTQASTPPATPASTQATPITHPADDGSDAEADSPDIRQRREVAAAISSLAEVDKAQWSTQSTLLVYLNAAGQDDPMKAICPLLERYPDLRASRVQLQAPPGSDQPVRFRQCVAY